METSITQLQREDILTEIVALISKGIECWSRAGELVVKLMDEHGWTITDLTERSEFLTENVVRRFEQLGRKQLVPKLLVAEYPAAAHIMRLGYSQQRQVLQDGVDLLLLHRGQVEVLRVQVENLAPKQCRQVFDKGRVRTLEAQRAFLENKAEEEKAAAPIPAEEIYVVKGRKVIFRRPCELNIKQLQMIMRLMQPTNAAS